MEVFLRTFILIFLLLLGNLQARENPFFPTDDQEDIPLTTNQISPIPPLKRASITLPSTARVIEEVIVKYKTLDGAQHTKSIELENSIDWHLPLFISQSYTLEKEHKPRKKKASKQRVKKTKKVSHFKTLLKLQFIKFYEKQDQLKIITEDKMLRDFLLVKPHRIVCDFQRDTDLRSFVKEAPKNSQFTKIRLGTHKGYYRAVIELDGFYAYDIEKLENGYLIQLR